MSDIIILSSIITAIATVVIAFYAIKSHQLTEAIKTKSAEERKKFNDILKAIATSTLLSASGQVKGEEFGRRVDQFNKWNEGGLKLSTPEG